MKKELQSKDLRIGNLVKSVITNQDYKMDTWGLRVIEDGNYQNSYNTETRVFNPITITEEWLLKFGFLKDFSGIYRFWKFECYDYLKDEDCIRIYFGGDEDNPIEITYIHELQNLYFALTGEELELKNETKP
jgi:hypothetical protein